MSIGAGRGWARAAAVLGTTVAMAGGTTHVLGAQATSALTVSAATTTFATPAEADYDAGASRPLAITFSVGPRCKRLGGCQVSVRGAPFNGRPVADLEWQLNGTAGPWTTMTLVDAPVVFIPANGTYTGVLHVRVRLAWNAQVAGTTYAPVVTLSVIQ